MLLGADLVKGRAVLEAAYDDAAGVTAAFDLNLLHRLNREAGADFDVAAFRHRAIWNETLERVEMHLVAERAQVVRLAGRSIRFAAGREHPYREQPQVPAGAPGRAGRGRRLAGGAALDRPAGAVLGLAAGGIMLAGG